MSEYVEGQGRGGWTTRGKENGMTSYGLVPGTEASQFDGAAGAVSEWHNRVRRGVRAIDKLLVLAGVPGGTDDHAWIFGPAMKDRVLGYQQSVGIVSVYGYVGGTTMRHLTRVHVESIALEHLMHPRWLWAQVSKESAFDPGAEGWTTPADSGLVQCNTADTDVTLDEAYDPIKALRIGARRWVASRDKYLAAGAERVVAINGAIAQHKSPAAADAYVASGGVWTSSEMEEYVRLTRQFAREWKTWKP